MNDELLQQNQWLRPNDVMRLLGYGGRPLSRKVLYRLIDSGRLQAKNLGTRARRFYVIHVSYLEDFRKCFESQDIPLE
jgi:hypothetical protein